MRIHGIQLRGLTAPSGDHQLVLDPGYTVLRVADSATARQLLAVTRALLYPESARVTQLDSRGRVVLTLALRADGCLIGADFARGRISLARIEASGSAAKTLVSDPHKVESHLQSFGLPSAEEFDWLHVCGASASIGATSGPSKPEVIRAPTAGTAVEENGARVRAERSRLLAEHEQQVQALGRERARLESEIEAAEQDAQADRERDETRLRELRVLEVELGVLEGEHRLSLAELEKGAAFGSSVEGFDARLSGFHTLVAEHDEERSVIEDKRADLLADRARLRIAPRQLLVPIVLGLALGGAGAAAGAVGYPAGYALSAAGILALLVSLVATRIVRARLGRIETYLAVLRVRERTAERRFESEGSQIRGLMLALGAESIDDLRAAARGYSERLERVELEKSRLAELAERYPVEARAERVRLEQRLLDGESNPALNAVRSALLALPNQVPLPTLPEETNEVAWPRTDADTAVNLLEKPDEDPEPAVDGVGPEALIASASRVLDRSEAELRARLGPVLPVYLRALSMGIFTNARAGDGGSWVLRGAARDEQPFTALPERERELVRLAVQLALLEAFAGERRVPLLIGPDLPARGENEQRALARAFKRLASVVQVIQVVTESAPWTEQAGKSFEL